MAVGTALFQEEHDPTSMPAGAGRVPAPRVKQLAFVLVALELALCLCGWDLLFRALIRVQALQGFSVVRGARAQAYAQEQPAYLASFLLAHLLLLPLLHFLSARGCVGEWGLSRSKLRLALRPALAVLLIALTFANLDLLFAPLELHMRKYNADGAGDLLVLGILAPIFAGVPEEVLFRGYLHRTLAAVEPCWGPVIAGAAFTIGHGPGLGYIVGATGALCYSALYGKHRSLWAAIFCHSAYDSIYFLELAVFCQHRSWQRWGAGVLAAAAGFAAVFLRREIADLGRYVWALGRGLTARPGFHWMGGALMIGLFALSYRFLFVCQFREPGATPLVVGVVFGLSLAGWICLAARRPWAP